MKAVLLSPLQRCLRYCKVQIHLLEAPDVDLDLQLPHQGGLVRIDIGKDTLHLVGFDRNAAGPDFDEDAARSLMDAAGYGDGFSFGLRCTNDRYLNDEAVCQAITGMLQRVGLDARLETLPVRNYWTELREGNYDMFLLGWSPGTFDAEHPIRFLAATPDGARGTWNFGGYSNARVDELLPLIQQELDAEQRQAMLDEVTEILQDEVAYVPLYTEPLAWAAREGIDLVQRPDNFFMLRWVTVN